MVRIVKTIIIFMDDNDYQFIDNVDNGISLVTEIVKYGRL